MIYFFIFFNILNSIIFQIWLPEHEVRHLQNSEPYFSHMIILQLYNLLIHDFQKLMTVVNSMW